MAGVVELGAHLTTRRFGYVHHGIYVGAGKVIHYAGFSLGLIAGPIEVTSLASFSGRSGFDVRACPRREFAPESVVARAYSRIGERKYDVLRNNCEHFCEWCLTGKARSFQVEKWLNAFRSWVGVWRGRPSIAHVDSPVC
jgi:hypothetical protein